VPTYGAAARRRPRQGGERSQPPCRRPFLKSGQVHPRRSTARRRYTEGSGRRPRGEAPPWTGSLLLKAPLDPPKRAEFHLAKRLLKEAEELLARGDYVQASEKAWGAAAQIVKAAKKGKELKSRGGPSAKQPAKTES